MLLYLERNAIIGIGDYKMQLHYVMISLCVLSAIVIGHRTQCPVSLHILFYFLSWTLNVQVWPQAPTELEVRCILNLSLYLLTCCGTPPLCGKLLFRSNFNGSISRQMPHRFTVDSPWKPYKLKAFKSNNGLQSEMK